MSPRVLIVTRNLPPLVGGMERLNWHMAQELARRSEVRVIGPAGAAASAPAGVPVTEVSLRPLGKFLGLAQLQALREARRFRPGLVLAGSGLTAPLALLAARRVGARAAVYVHGLDLAVAHPLYRRLWLPALRRMDRVIANSHATRTLALKAGIDAARIGIVHPGVEVPASLPGDDAVRAFRQRHGLGERPLLLSVGRLSERKGIREFVVDVLPHIVAARPDVLFVVIGAAPADALHAKAQTPAQILEEARRAGVAGHVHFLGSIDDAELSVAYRASAVHVFPIRELPGDPEGFGMVAVEAAAHGLPTVAYATGGVVDAVAGGVSGCLVPPGDAAAFARAVLKLLAQPLEEAGIRVFAERFNWDEFGKRLWLVLT